MKDIEKLKDIIRFIVERQATRGQTGVMPEQVSVIGFSIHAQQMAEICSILNIPCPLNLTKAQLHAHNHSFSAITSSIDYGTNTIGNHTHSILVGGTHSHTLQGTTYNRVTSTTHKAAYSSDYCPAPKW